MTRFYQEKTNVIAWEQMSKCPLHICEGIKISVTMFSMCKNVDQQFQVGSNLPLSLIHFLSKGNLIIFQQYYERWQLKLLKLNRYFKVLLFYLWILLWFTMTGLYKGHERLFCIESYRPLVVGMMNVGMDCHFLYRNCVLFMQPRLVGFDTDKGKGFKQSQQLAEYIRWPGQKSKPLNSHHFVCHPPSVCLLIIMVSIAVLLCWFIGPPCLMSLS